MDSFSISVLRVFGALSNYHSSKSKCLSDFPAGIFVIFIPLCLAENIYVQREPVRQSMKIALFSGLYAPNPWNAPEHKQTSHLFLFLNALLKRIFLN